MKEKIKNYFRTDRSYFGGIALVMEFSQKLALKRQLNVQPPCDYIIGVIHEELRTLAGLSPDEMTRLIRAPHVEDTKPEAAPEAPPVSPDLARSAPKAPAGNSKTGKPASKKASRKK